MIEHTFGECGADRSRIFLEQAQSRLTEAYAAQRASVRYVTAQDAAMRAAAALVIGPGARGRQDMWALLTARAPELSEWADSFALAAVRRAHLQRVCPELSAGERHDHHGCPARVAVHEADDLVRSAEDFIGLVGRRLGLPGEPTSRGRRAALR